MTNARLTALLLLLFPAAARAEAPILLESYAGDRPDEVAEYVQQIVAAMRGEGEPLRGTRLRNEIEARISRSPGSRVPAASLKSAVEEGGRLFIEGEFAAAIARLERARTSLLQHSAGLASDPALRGTLHRALLFLAHAYLRSKLGEQATERVGEAIRSFPDRDLSLVQVQYGPELVSLYRRVRAELDKQGRGTLSITTDPPGCMVFLNERFAGVSPARVADLYPGRYRIYVQRQQHQGRVHEVTVREGEQAVQIHFALDSVLQTDGWVGLRFPDLAAQDRDEVRLASELAQALDAPSVLLIGFRRHQGRKALVGSVISPVTGRLRTAIVVVEPTPPSPATLKALARFLVDGQGGADGLIIPGPGPAAGSAQHDTHFFSSRVFKWVTLGIAAGCLASGVTLLAIDGRGTCDDGGTRRCPDAYDTLLPGALLTGAGGLAAAGSGFLFYWDHRQRSKERAPSAALLPWVGRGAGLTAILAY